MARQAPSPALDIWSRMNVTKRGQRLDFQLLVDCGLFQGQKEWRVKNWTDLPVSGASDPRSHPHPRPSGPLRMDSAPLTRRASGVIYATPSTVDLCGIILPDSGSSSGGRRRPIHNKQKTSKHSPGFLCTPWRRRSSALSQFRAVPFGETVQLTDGVSFRFVRAAHILGSAMAEISLNAPGKRRSVLFLQGGVATYTTTLAHRARSALLGRPKASGRMCWSWSPPMETAIIRTRT